MKKIEENEKKIQGPSKNPSTAKSNPFNHFFQFSFHSKQVLRALNTSSQQPTSISAVAILQTNLARTKWNPKRRSGNAWPPCNTRWPKRRAPNAPSPANTTNSTRKAFTNASCAARIYSRRTPNMIAAAVGRHSTMCSNRARWRCTKMQLFQVIFPKSVIIHRVFVVCVLDFVCVCLCISQSVYLGNSYTLCTVVIWDVDYACTVHISFNFTTSII